MNNIRKVSLTIFQLTVLCVVVIIFYYALLHFSPTIEFYICVILFSVSLLSFYINDSILKGQMFCSFLVLFFILGFRNESGIDDPSYYAKYLEVGENISFKLILQGNEPLFLLLNIICNKLGFDYLTFQKISSFIPLLIVYAAIYRLRRGISVPLAVLIFIGIIYFQILAVALVRMFFAISIVLYAITILPQSRKKYYKLILVASLFHFSSIIMFALGPIVAKANFNKKWKRSIIYITILYPVVLLLVVRLVSAIGSDRYLTYSKVNEFSFNMSSLSLIPILIYAWCRLKIISESMHKIFKICLIMLATSSIITFYSGIVSLGRLIFYMNLSLIILLPCIYKNEKTGLRKLIAFTIIVSYVFLYLYISKFNLEAHIPYLVPYQNIYFTF